MIKINPTFNLKPERQLGLFFFFFPSWKCLTGHTNQETSKISLSSTILWFSVNSPNKMNSCKNKSV
jgi:hypothetical protein